MAPIVSELRRQSERIDTIAISSAQHTHLVRPFAQAFDVEIDHDLEVGQANQSVSDVAHRCIESFSDFLKREPVDLVLVQGDTTTALAGALAAFYAEVPVAHVEAGLRSGDAYSPFPEEMNRRLITRLAALHFAATEQNVETLLAEGVAGEHIHLTGNPVVDALNWTIENRQPGRAYQDIVERAGDRKLMMLTTHRRESFGEVMLDRLVALRDFVERHEDICLAFPVHPNPSVREAVSRALGENERIVLTDPLDYFDFVHLLKAAWLIVTDSGGVQEEAPTLATPVLVIRDRTERTEAVEAGTARLVGTSAKTLDEMLERSYTDPSWWQAVRDGRNPFGAGRAAREIVSVILERFAAESRKVAP